MSESFDLVMWGGCVRSHDFLGQLEATAAAGLTHLSLTAYDLKMAMNALGGPREVRAAARDHGVEFDALDTVPTWCPVVLAAGTGEALRARFDFTVEECMDLATAVGMRSLLAVAVFEPGAVPEDDVIRGFAGLCDAAAARDLHVELEFMPFWGVADLPTARGVVEAAGRPNSGIMVDTWHFARGDGDLDVLERTARDIPLSLQIADGSAQPVGSDPLTETMQSRRLPGDGQFMLVSIIRTALASGRVRTVGPEIFSLELDALPAAEIGRRVGASTRKVLQAAASPSRQAESRSAGITAVR